MKPILTLLFMLFALLSHAQTEDCSPKIKYQYDAAGNRVVRQAYPICRLADNQEESPQNPNTPNLANDEGFEVTLFPNPTQGLMQAQVTTGFMELGNKNVAILSLKGELIYNQKITRAPFTLNFSAYATGYYIVRITADGYNKQWKVQKE